MADDEESGDAASDPGALAQRAIDAYTAYRRTGGLPLLTEAVDFFRAARAAVDDLADPAERAMYDSNLGGALQALFERTGDVVALHEAADAVRAAANALPDGHPERVIYLANLGNVLQRGFAQLGDMDLLNEAVSLGRQAVQAAPTAGRERSRQLVNLGAGLRTVFGRTGETAALVEAISAIREALAFPGHADRGNHLYQLSTTLDELYRLTGRESVLVEAVETARASAAVLPAGHPDLAAALSHLGVLLRLWFERTGQCAALFEAVDCGRLAVAATAPGRVSVAGHFSNLANALGAVFDHTGEIAALREAVEFGRQAVAAAPTGRPDRHMYLSNAGNLLRRLVEQTGEIALLDEAVGFGRLGVVAIPAGHPDRPAAWSNLTGILQRKYEYTGELTVLAEAVDTGRTVLAETPPNHIGRAAAATNLCSALHELFVRTGDVDALTESVAAGRTGVVASVAGNAEHITCLSNLGSALQALYGQTGETTALLEAVSVYRRAVAAGPADGPDRPGHLSNLANALSALTERTENKAVAAEAVEVARQAVTAFPAGHPGLATALSTLCGALQRQYAVTGETALLAETVEAGRAAVAALPADHPDQPGRLSNLGGALLRLSTHSDDPAILAEAVDVGRQAVSGEPADHPARAAYLNNLGGSLRTLFDRTGSVDALTESGRCFAKGGRLETAPVAVRVACYHSLLGLPQRPGWSALDDLDAAEAAAGLLAQITPRTLVRADREYGIGQLSGLAARTASAAVAAGRPERAVQLLEQTRGVLVADVLDARGSDLGRLRRRSPDLAARFESLRDHLEKLERLGSAAPKAGSARREAVADWTRLLGRVRALDGFADFLGAPSTARLAEQAGRGPVVYIYASPTRSDALILTADPERPVRVVELPALTHASAVDTTNRFLRACRALRNDADLDTLLETQSEILEVLGWIWDAIAEPVLTTLGFTGTPARDWPRLWWCPIGFLAYLPLHAAGHLEDLGPFEHYGSNHESNHEPLGEPGHPRTVLDRVISSYAITVRALRHARAGDAPGIDARDGQSSATGTRVAVVSVPDAPGTPVLTGVVAEAKAIVELVPGARELPHPSTRAAVLEALPEYPVTHFACHGLTDWANPSMSRLLLHDHDIAQLTVADISTLRLGSGSLAYLSACDTATTRTRLADEAVHITGAFHLAGYQNVIGTLWPVHDHASRRVAVDFYRHLTNDGATAPDTTISAAALHQAVRRARARHPLQPTLWAPYLHTGD